MKYSIITCVYNAQVYIQDYFNIINSIEYADFEIVLVDDCSDDNTESLINNEIKNSKHDIKFRRLEKNSGPGNARNIGLLLASGEYIVFIDVDDRVNNKIFNRLDQYSDFDVVCFDYYTFSDDQSIIQKNTLVNPSMPISSINDLAKRTTGCVWGKRFKKNIIEKHDIQFPDLYKSEDLVFLIRYLMRCCSFDYCKEQLYGYRISNNSLMHRKIDNQIECARSAINMIKQDALMAEDVYQVVYMKEIIYDLTNVYIKLGKGRDELRTFWNEEKTNWKVLNEKNSFNRNQRIVLTLIKYKLYCAIWLINKFR